VFEDTASVLFGMDGLRITDAEPGPDGAVTVWAVTDHPGAAACPGCGRVSSRVHESFDERLGTSRAVRTRRGSRKGRRRREEPDARTSCNLKSPGGSPKLLRAFAAHADHLAP